MNLVRIFLRLFVTIAAVLISLRITILLLQRMPGVIVALSLIALAVLTVIFKRGGFRAIGLRNKHAVVIAMAISGVLFILSTAILIFVNR